MPSFEILKSDSRIQLEVARRLDEYQNASRVEIGKPTTVLKSGRYRAGVSKVKIHVNWPQDFCSVPGNSNSNWTFIALNLPKQEDSKAQQNKKQPTKFCVQGHNRGRTPRRTPGG